MWMAILKNLNHRKIIRKTQINNILLKTKTILKPKYKLSGGPVSTFSLPRGDDSPLHPAVSYATDFTTAQRWLEISPVKLAYHRREAVWWMLVRSRKRLPRNVANGTANGKTAKNTLHRTQWRSQPKIWGGKVWGEKCLILGEKQFFCLGRCLSRHKMTRYAKNLGGTTPGSLTATYRTLHCPQNTISKVNSFTV